MSLRLNLKLNQGQRGPRLLNLRPKTNVESQATADTCRQGDRSIPISFRMAFFVISCLAANSCNTAVSASGCCS